MGRLLLNRGRAGHSPHGSQGHDLANGKRESGAGQRLHRGKHKDQNGRSQAEEPDDAESGGPPLRHQKLTHHLGGDSSYNASGDESGDLGGRPKLGA
jgi:hypothetical protein